MSTQVMIHQSVVYADVIYLGTCHCLQLSAIWKIVLWGWLCIMAGRPFWLVCCLLWPVLHGCCGRFCRHYTVHQKTGPLWLIQI